MSHYCQVVEALCESSLEVVPLKQRGSPLQKPVAAKCICIYKQDEVRRCHHLLFRYFYSIFPYLVISLLRSISARTKSLIWSVIFQRKIEEVNQLFCDFERREATCNRPELSQLAIDDQLVTLQMKLEEFEMTLTSMITSPLPRDLDQFEQFVVNYRQLETKLKSLQLELESMKENVEACPCQTPQMQSKYCLSLFN